MTIEFANESGVEVPDQLILDAARFAIAALDVNPAAELSVLCVDLDTMADMHVQWMDLPGPTDVMSFPMDELRPGRDGMDPEQGVLGDIVLCPSVAERQAREAGHAPIEELLLLTTHGLLHLLGFDHAEPDEKREMFELQRQLLLTYLAGRGRR